MKIRLMLLLALLFLFPTSLNAKDYLLPHVANGIFAGGSIRTTFVFFNPTGAVVSVELILTRDDGSPLEVVIPELGTNSTFTLTLQSGETRLLQTDGSGPLTSGAAKVVANGDIGVSGIFTLLDGNGNFLTEAGIGDSQPLTDFVIPVDARGTFSTGIALFNFGTGSITVTLNLIDASGQQRASISITLTPGQHLARFVVGDLFAGLTEFQGTLVVTSSGAVAALTLRQNGSPLSFTTLPVVPRSSTQVTFILPQVANGTFAAGSIRTTFIIFNFSSATANVALTLSKDDGSPFTATIPGTGTASTFNIALAPGAAVFLQTDGAGSLTAGAASVSSNVPVGVTAIFTILDTQGGFLTEAGIGDSPALTQFTLPVNVTSKFNTGVAFFVPGSDSVTVTVRQLDANGFLIASVTITLKSKEHLARFATDLFSGLQNSDESGPLKRSPSCCSPRSQLQNFIGSFSIVASGPIAALILRQNSDPLSFTTLRVAEGAVEGRTPPPAALLSQTKTGIDATANVTVNATLPSGFRITGTISGPAFFISSITARSSDGTLFTGTIDATSKKYLIVVPAGTYTLVVCFTPQLDLVAGLPTVTHEESSAVQVSADIVRDITLPAVTTFAVSGSVSGLTQLPTNQGASLSFTSSDLKSGGFTAIQDGNFQIQLPNGTFTVSVFVVNLTFTATQTETLTIFNVGSVVVSGSNVNANFSLPAQSKISGTVSAAGLMTIPANSTVIAADTSAPPVTNILCIFPATASTATVDSSGPFQMNVANGRGFQLFVAIPIGPDGTVVFPIPARQVAVSGDTTQNFNLSALPARVTISGRVTDSSGKGVDKVTVIATTQQITGVADAVFTAVKISDANGNFSMEVLSGTNFELTFAPPLPSP